MIIKISKSKKGSSLVFVLIFLSVLSILGTTILSVSIANYKMKIIDKNSKTSFYLAEAGLQEAYTEIGKEIKKGIEEGNKKVKYALGSPKFKEFIQAEREKEKATDDNGAHTDDSIFIKGKDGNGEIDFEKIKPMMKEWFRVGFAAYINENLKTKLSSKGYSVVDPNIDSNQLSVAVKESITTYQIDHDLKDETIINLDDKKKPIPYVKKDTKPYKITLQSDFTHKNIQKQIQGTFTIKIPDYDAPFYVKSIWATLNENVLWKKAITTEKNLYIKGNDVTINGDIYAYGTMDDNNVKNMGGVVAGDGGILGKVTINGTVATNSYIHTNEDNSSITIDKGDVYCNSLVVQEGTTKGTITIQDGAVNTKDDIELNGKQAKIIIKKSYYGFSDGSGSVRHDNSSSIVINSDDLGNGSSLVIRGGKASDHEPDNPESNSDNPHLGNNTYKSGVFISGTAYINLGDNKYQTGESVSIKGNYIAYGDTLDPDEDYGTGLGQRNIKFHPDNVHLEAHDPLLLIKSRGQPFTAEDKSKYFKYYNDDYQGLLNLGKDKSVSFGENSNAHIFYNVGAVVNKGNIIESQIPAEIISSKGKEPVEDFRGRKLKDYYFYVNKMADYAFGLNPQDLAEGELVKPLTIENRVHFNQLTNNEFKWEQKKEDIKEIACISDSKDKDVYIIGQRGTAPTPSNDKIIYQLEDNITSLKGIVVTKGNIYLRGKLNYNGALIAKGNIYIEDDKKKNISHDEDYILKTVYILDGTQDGLATKKNLKQFFEFKENDPTWPKETKKTFLYESEVGKDDVTSHIKYGDIIDVYWKKVR
jgi:hypothetical protein